MSVLRDVVVVSVFTLALVTAGTASAMPQMPPRISAAPSHIFKVDACPAPYNGGCGGGPVSGPGGGGGGPKGTNPTPSTPPKPCDSCAAPKSHTQRTLPHRAQPQR
jgi:hypothetical protein